jgi:hypothetical protein
MNPAKEYLEGRNASGQGLGATTLAAAVLHPVEKLVEACCAGLRQFGIIAKITYDDLEIVAEGFDRIFSKFFALHEVIKGAHRCQK